MEQNGRCNSASRVSIREKEDQQYITQYVLSISGQTSSRKYKKCGLLGNGGFAHCYIVENTQTKKRAAAKIIPKQGLTTYRTKLRLMNEIRLHKTLHHPNVVEFYHHFEDKHNVYIFLELCENQSLNQLLKIREHLTTPQIQAFTYGLIQGIKYLHSKHVIHRDLKLGNIFIDESLNIKIGDFGLATKLEFERQFKRTICGTPNYIAPQILEGKGYHFQVDIWSIGVIIYTLYMGCPPFQTEEAATTYKKIKEVDYILPPKNIGVPLQAINLIKKILVKNPSKRPTLDQILKSDFMNLGNGIIMNLPKVCIKKAPSRKQLKENSFIHHTRSCSNMKVIKHRRIPSIESLSNINVIKKSTEEQVIIKKKNYTSEFVKQIQELPDGSYIYHMNDDSKAILSKQGMILFRNKDDKLIKFSARKSQQEADRICMTYNSHRNILGNKDKNRQSLENEQRFDTHPQELFSGMVYLQKITKYKSCHMLRLSNHTVQLLFEKGDGFFISKPQQVFYFDKSGAVKWVNASSILNLKLDDLPVDKAKVNYVRNLLRLIREKQTKMFYTN